MNRASGGMAIGINSQVTPEYNPILVNSTDLKTNYTAELSMALGYGAKALNSDSIAIGQFTEVLGQRCYGIWCLYWQTKTNYK
ncbi:TPA: hypothetical protein ACPP6G_001511 [Haemophilus influenzae]